MNTSEIKEKDFKKVDQITKIITIILCVCLGAVFLGACVYMMEMITAPQDVQNTSDTNVPQNMNLVSM